MTAEEAADRRTLVRLELAREVSLALVTAASVVALGRLFTGSEHAAPLLAHVVLAHVVVSVCRRRGLHLAATAAVAAAAGLVAVAVVHYPATTTLGIPGPATFHAIGDDLDTAVSLFGEAPTPTEPLVGFLVLSAAAVWVTVFVADWAAFRLGVPLEAVLPAATIFVFAAVLADGRQRTGTTLVAVASALAYFLVHRVSRQVRTGRWIGPDRSHGVSALLTVGAALGTVALLAAVVGGPSLPGAGNAAIVELEPSNDRPAPRVIPSPWVDLRRRLIDQSSQTEMFTVRSETRAYWRLTSLDTFDGRIWSSSGSYGEVAGELPDPEASASESAAVEQRFTITGLGAIWLPAAFEPRSIRNEEVAVRYEDGSATLIVDTDVPDSDGLTYTVRSEQPRVDPADLRSTGEQEVPAEVAEANLQLPDGFPAEVRSLAEDLTAGAADTYERALALQDFFREEFEYSLQVPTEYGGDALERFLFEDRRGYCQQFAGAYAAMARSLGIPARVGVGFTPGIEVEPGVFSVRAENAHAWPEVFVPGEGWVLFEPTPGRGAPFAESYTGVPEQQAVRGEVTRPETPAEAPGGPSDTGPAPPEVDPETGELGVEAGGAGAEPSPAGADEDPSAQGPVGWILEGLRFLVVPGLVAVGLGVLYATVVTTSHRLRRRRRRRAATTPPERVLVAWEESLEDLRLLGLTDHPASTHDQTGRVVEGLLPDQRAVARELARLAEASVYAEGEVGEDEAELAEHGAGEIGVAVRDRSSRRDRSMRALDPRPLVPKRILRSIGQDRGDR